LAVLAVASTQCARAQFYVQTNLQSDLAGMAMMTDSNLVGAWGTTHSTNSPWWVNTTFSGLSLLFNGAGQALSLVVHVPPTNGIGATATGIAFYGGNGFQVASNAPARFIFATLNGLISGWNPAANPTVGIVVISNSLGGYTGLTIAQNKGQDFLYAANYLQDRLEVYDTNFMPVSLPSGAFTDKKVPNDMSVFNVQLVGDSLYVTYAPTNVFAPGATGPGRGFVNVFDVEGNLQNHLKQGFWMNAPWGITLAPPDGFGRFNGHVLVGMFGSGVIAAFDVKNGKFDDFIRNTDALPLIISKGLWGLGFGNGASAGPTNVLYFASDFVFGNQFHGLFGTITAAPPVEGEHDMDNSNDDHEGEGNNNQGDNQQGDNHKGDN
jgi:uncharacterized protein (TIGR03118 family)